VVSRTLKPELLDALPPEDRDAIDSRRDLRHFNRVMGNAVWFRAQLPVFVRPGERILELGAGTGEIRSAVKRPDLSWDGLDLAPRPADWPPTATWYQTDVRDFDGWSDYDVILANLFLHHLDDPTLVRLGGRMRAHARVILCSEPARARRWQWLFRGLCLMVRANHVSRHDGHVSIEAGFRNDELPRTFGLGGREWAWKLDVTFRGAYRLSARRSDA